MNRLITIYVVALPAIALANYATQSDVSHLLRGVRERCIATRVGTYSTGSLTNNILIVTNWQNDARGWAYCIPSGTNPCAITINYLEVVTGAVTNVTGYVAGDPEYAVNPLAHPYVWTGSVAVGRYAWLTTNVQINAVGQVVTNFYTNDAFAMRRAVITNIGEYAGRDLMDTIGGKARDVLPYYAEEDTTYNGTTNIVMWTYAWVTNETGLGWETVGHYILPEYIALTQAVALLTETKVDTTAKGFAVYRGHGTSTNSYSDARSAAETDYALYTNSWNSTRLGQHAKGGYFSNHWTHYVPGEYEDTSRGTGDYWEANWELSVTSSGNTWAAYSNIYVQNLANWQMVTNVDIVGNTADPDVRRKYYRSETNESAEIWWYPTDKSGFGALWIEDGNELHAITNNGLDAYAWAMSGIEGPYYPITNDPNYSASTGILTGETWVVSNSLSLAPTGVYEKDDTNDVWINGSWAVYEAGGVWVLSDQYPSGPLASDYCFTGSGAVGVWTPAAGYALDPRFSTAGTTSGWKRVPSDNPDPSGTYTYDSPLVEPTGGETWELGEWQVFPDGGDYYISTNAVTNIINAYKAVGATQADVTYDTIIGTNLSGEAEGSFVDNGTEKIDEPIYDFYTSPAGDRVFWECWLTKAGWTNSGYAASNLIHEADHYIYAESPNIANTTNTYDDQALGYIEDAYTKVATGASGRTTNETTWVGGTVSTHPNDLPSAVSALMTNNNTTVTTGYRIDEHLIILRWIFNYP